MAPSAADWAAHYATPAGYRTWPCEELVRFCGSRGFRLGDRVLEVGCGNGANLWFLANYVDVVGIDMLQPVLREAASYCAYRGCGIGTADSWPGHRVWNMDVSLTAADAGRLPFAAGAFDGVVDCMVSQHMPWMAHERVYAGYRRVLKPGGWLWLYHLDNLTVTHRGLQSDVYDWGALALFPSVRLFCLPPSWALRGACEDAGFVRRSVRGLAVEYENGSVAHYTSIAAEAA